MRASNIISQTEVVNRRNTNLKFEPSPGNSKAKENSLVGMADENWNQFYKNGKVDRKIGEIWDVKEKN